MKIGFIDCSSNTIDGFAIAGKECEGQADVELVRVTAPDILKAPVCAKKAFSEHSTDAAIIYFECADEDADALALIHEKMIDVEIEHGKFAFFCVILGNASEELVQERIADVVKRVLQHARSAPSIGQALDWMTGAATVMSGETAPSVPPSESEPMSFLEEEPGMHKLF